MAWHGEAYPAWTLRCPSSCRPRSDPGHLAVLDGVDLSLGGAGRQPHLPHNWALWGSWSPGFSSPLSPVPQDPAGVMCATSGFLHRPLRLPGERACSESRVPSEALQQVLAPRSRPVSLEPQFPSLDGAASLQASSCCLSCVTTPGRLNAHLGVGDLLPWWARLLSSKLGLISHAGHACPSLSDRSVARGPPGARLCLPAPVASSLGLAGPLCPCPAGPHPQGQESRRHLRPGGGIPSLGAAASGSGPGLCPVKPGL